MNCQAVQNKILALPDPRHVPDSLRAHVVGCAACRAWAEQAARLESLLEHLPAPPAPTDKKAALIEELSRPVVATPAAPRHGSPREFLRRNAVLVAGLAAAILVALGAWLIPGKPKPTPELVAEASRDPFLEKVVQSNVALARADTPGKKLAVLGARSDLFSAEARSLARLANPEELKDFVRWYEKTKGDIVKQAGKMEGLAINPAERKAQLEALARKMGATADEMRKASGEVPPAAKPVLEQIADMAQDGQKALQKLAS